MPSAGGAPHRLPRPAPGRWRHLLLGDWHPLVRDPIDLLRATFLLSAAALLVLGDTSASLRMALTFGLLVLARQLDLPRIVDLGFVLGMGLQAYGNALDLFVSLPWYDKLVHFFLTFFTAPVFYVLLIRMEAVPDLPNTHPGRRGAAAVVIITLALGTAFGALYEVYEYVVDHTLGAGLQIGYHDTINDLVGDALASLLGGVLLVIWARFGWDTSRRVPGPPER